MLQGVQVYTTATALSTTTRLVCNEMMGSLPPGGLASAEIGLSLCTSSVGQAVNGGMCQRCASVPRG